MAKQLTPWFPADVTPAREGVYEKDFMAGRREYQYWCGKRWWYGASTPEKTLARYTQNRYIHPPNSRPWRGLAEQPK